MRLEGKYGFLGYGNMGEAILSGLLDTGIVGADQVRIYDPVPARMEAAKGRHVICVGSPEEMFPDCDTLLMAVKPQSLDEAFAPLRGKTPPDIRVISIMAGVSIAALINRFGDQARIIRVMPNTPALVGAGATAMAHSNLCTPADVEVATAIFSAVGIVEVVPEDCMDAVTALSGSGPAYYFYLTECLVNAGVAEGLSEPLARRLAGHTLMGAGKLLVESGDPPEVLRERVTSKGGVTFAALESLRSNRYENIIQSAIHAATGRSRELGQ